MQKTILIPTDFSIESLIQVKQAVAANEGVKLDIVLLYCSLLPDSITELLFYSPEKIINEFSSPEFKQAISMITNKYANEISSVKIEVFHGFSISAFENFITANKITQAFIPKNYTLKETANSFNPIPFIRKSSIGYSEIEWKQNKSYHAKSSLAGLFLD